MTNTPLVMLCGMGCDSDALSAQVAALGGIALVAQGETVEAMAADILARMSPRASLAGHSMGGYIALAIQRLAPERVARLALLNTTAAPDTQKERESRIAILAAIQKHGYEAIAARLASALADDPEVICRVVKMLARAGVHRFTLEQRAAFSRPDARLALCNIEVPTLVIGSEDDRILPPQASIELANLIRSAELIMLQGAGHAAPMSQPGAVTRAMGKWLQR